MGKTKAAEVEEFRLEVQKYLKTGKSDMLTAGEKEKLDKVRPKPATGILARIGQFFRN